MSTFVNLFLRPHESQANRRRGIYHISPDRPEGPHSAARGTPQRDLGIVWCPGPSRVSARALSAYGKKAPEPPFPTGQSGPGAGLPA